MRDDKDRCYWLRRRINENQRRATELSIKLALDARDRDDVALLTETAARIESAVEELEQARRVLVSA